MVTHFVVFGAASARAVADRPHLSTVVVVRGGSVTDGARFSRFVTELALTLDGVAVLPVASGILELESQPLAEQLTEVERVAREQGATAAVWVLAASSGKLLVHVMELVTGRTIVRTVEAQADSRQEREVALVVRELLAVAEPVVSQGAVVAAPAAAPTVSASLTAPRPHPWQLESVASLQNGFGRKHGDWRRAELYAGVRWGVLGSLSAGGGLRVMSMPSAWAHPRAADATVQARGVGGELATDYDLTWRTMRFAPRLVLAAMWSDVRLELGGEPQDRDRSWSYRGSVGTRVALPLGYGLFLLLDGLVGYNPRRDVWRRTSSSEVVWSGGWLSWGAGVGLRFGREGDAPLSALLN